MNHVDPKFMMITVIHFVYKNLKIMLKIPSVREVVLDGNVLRGGAPGVASWAIAIDGARMPSLLKLHAQTYGTLLLSIP